METLFKSFEDTSGGRAIAGQCTVIKICLYHVDQKNMSLREVLEKPGYPYLKTGCIILWTIFLVWLLLPLIAGCNGVVLRIIVTLTISAILLGTLTPDPKATIHQFQENIESLTDTAIDSPTDTAIDSPVDKKDALYKVWQYSKRSGHFLLFTILGMSMALGFPMENRKLLLLNISILAGATELLQFFIEGRSPYFIDWIIDNAGAVLGLLLLYLFNLAGQAKTPVV